MIVVTLTDLRELDYCTRGARAWCTRMGIDWPAFLRDGIDADLLEASGDAMAIKAAQYARIKHGKQ
jgi:hypothetical protein